MELTLDQALQQGVEAHKAGQVQEADRLYTAILKAQPKHPDANHNMGVLAVGVGKVEEALPLFITALEANPDIVQFWLSYIDALIKLDRLADAKAIFDQAKQKGAKGDGFDSLEKRLDISTRIPISTTSSSQEIERFQPNILDSLKLDQALRLARKMAQNGSNEESERIYQNVLAKFPKNKRAVDGIKALVGEPVRKASKVQDPPQGQIQSLINLYNQGQLQKVLDQAAVLLNHFPNSSVLHNMCGVVFNSLDQLDDAIDSYKRALSIRPDYADAYNNIGNALQVQDKLEEAIVAYNKALSIDPDHADAHNNLGDVLQEQGKIEEAIVAFNKLLSLKPNYAGPYNKIGNALQVQGKLEEAIVAYNKALSIDPDHADAYNNMGIALQGQDKLEEAIVAYNRALAIKPDYAEAFNNMGNALKDHGKLEEEIEAYNNALAIKPDYADAYNNMGVALQDQGKIEEAIVAYNKALAIKPDFSHAYLNLSKLIKYKPNDPEISTVEALLKRPNLKDIDRFHLLYTFAKMNEDLGYLKAAYENYVDGGALRQKLLAYDHEQDQRLFADIKNTTPKLKKFDFNISNKEYAHTPIFILGMLRSGTTLVEQIISCHSKVQGAGELSFVSRFGSALAIGTKPVTYNALVDFRKSYFDGLAKVSGGNQLVTDKMPQNFKYIGLILKAFPEAKIIHVKRDPAANCWSNFKHYFASKDLGYSYNLNDTISYFKLYQDLMGFWNQQYSNQIYHLDYDRLTNEQEPETRKLLAYLSLDWEDACLAPQENKRSVRTASQQQVKEKIYKGSSQAWRKFKPYLKGVFDRL